MPPLPPNMPSLNSLRAFEAAARLGSFVRAAEELHTTPAGVAQHVKKVEAWAEQSLFKRSARGVQLNEAGTSVLPHLSEGFSAIGRASVALRAQRRHPSTLNIAALPALAQLWVVPRLAKIRALLPGVDISVHATDTPPDLEREPYDVAIFYAPVGASPDDLLSDELTPVAAPHIAATIKNPADLAKHNLLHDRAWKDHWQLWLASAGATDVDNDTGTSFTLYAMAIDAALRGDGVLAGRCSLVERHLEDGSLVAPFTRRVPTDDAVQIRFRDPVDPGLEPLVRLAHQTSDRSPSLGAL